MENRRPRTPCNYGQYRAAQDLGVCAICGEQDEKTAMGARYCARCAENRGEAYFASLGVCAKCGRPLDRRDALCSRCVKQYRGKYSIDRVRKCRTKRQRRQAG